MGKKIHQKADFLGGYRSPSNIGFVGPPELPSPENISISSVFLQIRGSDYLHVAYQVPTGSLSRSIADAAMWLIIKST